MYANLRYDQWRKEAIFVGLIVVLPPNLRGECWLGIGEGQRHNVSCQLNQWKVKA